MKMTRISKRFPAIMEHSVLRSLGTKFLMMLFISFMAFGTAEAQSTNDWVGNRQLVNGNAAVTRLKQAARTIVHQSNQQPPQHSTAVADGQGTDYHFILRVVEEIALNNRTSKEAINMVALALASEGVVTTELTRIAESLIAILS
jgi:hypothetical protein